MKYIVYQTINKVNGKLYIGVHGTKDPNHFDGYIGNGVKVGSSLKNPKTVFQRALKKYGFKNFERKVLYVFDTAEEAYKKEEEIVDLDFISKDSNYNTSLGGALSGVTYRKVYQYSESGLLLKVWDGGQAAIMETLGLSRNELYWALYSRVSLRQSFWSFTEITDFSSFRKRQEHYVYKFDLFGNLVDIYESISHVAQIFNLKRDTMKSFILEKRKYRGHYWTLDIDAIHDVIKTNKLFNTKRKYVHLLDVNGNIVKEYTSIKEAASDLGYKQKSISSFVYRKTLIKGKYYLQYVHEIDLSKKRVRQVDITTGEIVKVWDSLTSCRKEFPKCKDVIRGCRKQTKGYTFILEDD